MEEVNKPGTCGKRGITGEVIPLFFRQQMMRTRAYIVFLALFTGAVALAGCGLLPGGRSPAEIRVQLEGRDGAPVRLVTSLQFVLQRKIEYDETGSIPVKDTLIVSFITVDTSQVLLDFDRTYDIRRYQRFFLRAYRLEPATDNLRMRIWVDGQLKYDNEARSNQDSLQFIYYFIRPGEVIEEVL